MAEVNYSELTEEQLQIINDYCKKDMKKLKKVCYMVWGKKGLPYMYHDDLYDDAMNVLLESVVSFKSDKSAKFHTYLLGNVKRSYHDWFRDNRLRAKRSNLELDENGKIKKDENGNPIIIGNVPIDTPVGNEDGSFTIGDTIADKKTIESELFEEENKEEWRVEIKKYLEKLSPLQRKIALLLADLNTPEEICEELHITINHYKNSVNRIFSDEKIEILRPLVDKE